MRTCIMTVVSDPFVYGAVALLKSFRHANPNYAGDILVISNAENAPLSQQSRDIIRREDPEVRFHDASSQPYSRIFNFAETVIETPARLRAGLFILEAFRIEDYDCVLTLDSDMLVLGDLSRLFAIDAPFAVARAMDWANDRPLPYFNTGTMVIRHGRGDTISFDQIGDALTVDKVDPTHGKGDQAILNVALHDRPRHVIDERYNFSKRRVPQGVDPAAFLRDKDVRILHFLGQKPWRLKTRWSETAYDAVEKLWLETLLCDADADFVLRFARDLMAQGELLLGYVTPREPAADSRRSENALTRFFEEGVYRALDGAVSTARMVSA